MPSIILTLLTLLIGPALINGQETRNLERDKPVSGQNTARTALVIGNGKYTDAPLRNPPNDAADMATALATLGFEVLSYTDLDQTGMKRAIREFGVKLRTKGGVGLFYYAGHGVQSKGVNYLIPIGAKVDTEEEVEYESVEAGLVLAQMESAKNRMNIVILDACRNNPFARSYRSSEKGLASIDAPSGTLLAYSTAPGSVASDGSGRNGLYTQELLKQLKSPGLSIEDVFKQVRISVRSATTERQTPWEVSSLVGDFYFSGRPTDGSRSSIKAEPQEPAKLPSVDEILADYAKAVGADNATSISTLTMKGTVEGNYKGQKWTGSIETFYKRPGRSLTIQKFSGGTSTTAVYNGDVGWRYSKSGGTKEMPPEQLSIQKRSDALSYGDIAAFRTFYAAVTVKGKDVVGNRQVYVLEFVTPNNKTDRLYFGIESKLIYRGDFVFSSVENQRGISWEAEMYLDDYLSVNGLQVPTLYRQKDFNGEIVTRMDITGIKYNVALDDKLFKKP